MNNIINKNVSIGGKIIITDWRNTKIVAPNNLQDKVRANETAKDEIKKQKTQISNITATVVS